MIDVTKALRTRAGRKVRVVNKNDTTIPGYPLCVEIEDVPGKWLKRYYTKEGYYAASDSAKRFEHIHDLENVEPAAVTA